MKTVTLQTEPLQDKQSALTYFAKVFALEETPTNLDAFFDCMSEVAQDITLEVEECDLYAIAANLDVLRVFRTVLDAVEENPHLYLMYTGNLTA